MAANESAAAPPNVFISYRRDDSAGHAGRIYDRLCAELGAGRVFMDIDGIPLGRDFVAHLQAQVERCGYVLALMGRNWLDARDDTGGRRLDNPGDFVRIELAAALRRDIPVVPLLVDGATLPLQDQLPAGLESLARRQGISLTATGFHHEVARLAREIHEELTLQQREQAARQAEDFEAQRRRDEVARLQREAERDQRERAENLRREKEAQQRQMIEWQQADRNRFRPPPPAPAPSSLLAGVRAVDDVPAHGSPTLPTISELPALEQRVPVQAAVGVSYVGAPVSTGVRLLNYLFDSLICVFMFLLLSITIGGATMANASNSISLGTSMFSLVYYLTFESIFQRTPGKWLTQTKVVTDDYRRPSFGSMTIRTMSRFVPFDGLSFLGSAYTGWHDRWSKTQVVRAPTTAVGPLMSIGGAMTLGIATIYLAMR